MNKLSRRFLIVTFFIQIICWGSCAVLSANGITLSSNYLLYIPYMLGGWSPTVASYVVLRREGTVNNFKDWLKNVFDLKHSWLAYVFVIAMSVVYILPQCIISGYDNGAPLYALIFMIPMMLFGGGLEEAGWRYVLQPELEKKYPFILSVIIVAVIWWLWHLPLFYIDGVAQYGANYLAFGISVLGLSFALAAIRYICRSVWLCVLFHCLVNAISGVFIVNENILGNITSTVLLILISCTAVFVNKRKNSSPF